MCLLTNIVSIIVETSITKQGTLILGITNSNLFDETFKRPIYKLHVFIELTPQSSEDR